MMDASELLMSAPSDGTMPPVGTNRIANLLTSSKARLNTGKVAIVGKAPSSANMAPWQDESWEIWGLSNGAETYPRWSRWFEIHPLDLNKPRWPKEFWHWLTQDHGRPVYISEPHRDVKHATLYPRKEVMGLFGTYFTNSIAWMIALALWEKVTGQNKLTDIAVFGVDMACSDPAMGANGEYQYQRPCCEFYLGWARGIGVNLHLPDTSDLLKTASIYGIDPNADAYRKKMAVRDNELRQRIAKAEAEAQKAATTAAALRGALEDNAWHKQWVH